MIARKLYHKKDMFQTKTQKRIDIIKYQIVDTDICLCAITIIWFKIIS